MPQLVAWGNNPSVGEFILYVIPTDPTWQPAPDAAESTAAQARTMAGIPKNIYPCIRVEFFSRIKVAHPMENLKRIGCPRCGRGISVDWFDHLTDLESPNADGFDDLIVNVPCCGSAVSLADLDYEWPAGFSRFRITLWNPEHDLTSEHLAILAESLGHDLRVIHAR